MISRLTKFNPILPTVACAALLLAACDSTDLTGAAAGDVDDSSAAVALLAPFTGFYILQDDWNGLSGDVAYLIIEVPGSDGISPVSLYDYDDISNCVPERPFTGEVSKDIIILSTRVFMDMDNALLFDEAELFLSGSILTIKFNDDADFDNDGSTLDRVSVTATQLGISLVSDLGETC